MVRSSLASQAAREARANGIHSRNTSTTRSRKQPQPKRKRMAKLSPDMSSESDLSPSSDSAAPVAKPSLVRSRRLCRQDKMFSLGSIFKRLQQLMDFEGLVAPLEAEDLKFLAVKPEAPAAVSRKKPRSKKEMKRKFSKIQKSSRNISSSKVRLTRGQRSRVEEKLKKSLEKGDNQKPLEEEFNKSVAEIELMGSAGSAEESEGEIPTKFAGGADGAIQEEEAEKEIGGPLDEQQIAENISENVPENTMTTIAENVAEALVEAEKEIDGGSPTDSGMVEVKERAIDRILKTLAEKPKQKRSRKQRKKAAHKMKAKLRQDVPQTLMDVEEGSLKDLSQEVDHCHDQEEAVIGGTDEPEKEGGSRKCGRWVRSMGKSRSSPEPAEVPVVGNAGLKATEPEGLLAVELNEERQEVERPEQEVSALSITVAIAVGMEWDDEVLGRVESQTEVYTVKNRVLHLRRKAARFAALSKLVKRA